MNNKPVAWMCKSGFEYQQVKEDFSYKEKEGWIPLYTHPVKELTDEEIEEVIRKHWNREYKNRGMMEFAKAILRKAQEK